MDSSDNNRNNAVPGGSYDGHKTKLTFLDHVKNDANTVYSTFCRFPVSILLFAALAAIIIYRIEMPYEKIKDINAILDRISAVIVLGVPFTLSVNLLLERFWKMKNFLALIGIYIVELGLLTLYYIYLFPGTGMVPVTRIILIGFALGLAFLFIPYLFVKENFEIYITKIITKAVITVFFTIMLALGLVATLFTIKLLLYNDMNSKYFIYTWILASFVFAPLHFLHGFPESDDTFGIEHYNKVLKILLLYIILPIICVYTVVLYLYFAKIIITKVWPKGIVSNLVLSYTAVGIASIFLITPFRNQNKWARMFTSAYTKLIFPLLAMMFVSISIRIGEFGFTENRYFILVIGIWATLAMIFINLDKGRHNIILPVSLALTALLTVWGPWNAFNISKISQSERLCNILVRYDMIQNGKVVRSSSDVESKDKKEVVEILLYFDRSHKLSDLKYLPEDFNFGEMKDVFGFEDDSINDEFKRSYFHYVRCEDEPVEITGYDILFRYETLNYNENSHILFEKEIDSRQRNIKIYIDNNYTVSLLRDNAEILIYDMLDHVKALYSKYGENNSEIVAHRDLIIVTENNEAEVMIIFDSISGYADIDNQEIEVNNIAADIIVKIKDNGV